MPRSLDRMIQDMMSYWATIEKNVVLEGQQQLSGIFDKASRRMYEKRDLFYGLGTTDGRLAADPEELVKASRILADLNKDIDFELVGPANEWVKGRMPELLAAGRELTARNVVDVRGINQDLVRAAFEHVSTAERGVLRVGLQDQYKIMGTVGDDVGEWFRRTLMDAMVEGIPIQGPAGTDTLFSRLYESGRLKPQTIRSKDGRLIHRSLKQRAQAIARVENNKVINRVHEVKGEEALGGEAYYKDSGPIDDVTTEICLGASAQPPMTRQQWASSQYGLPPRLDKQFHLCRHFLIAVRKEWVDREVIEARTAAVDRERARRAEEAKRKEAAKLNRASRKAAPADKGIPVRKTGKTSKAFDAEIQEGLSTIPDDMQRKVFDNGGVLHVGEKTLDIRPDLKNEPGPWGKKGSWDECGGLFNAGRMEAVVAETELDRVTKAYRPQKNVPGVTRHEYGHMADSVLSGLPGDASDRMSFSRRFGEAWAKDMGYMEEATKKRLAYYTKGSTDRCRKETFAECFGVIHGGGCIPQHSEDFPIVFRNSMMAVKALLKKAMKP